MALESQGTRILRLHKRWADGWTLIWLVFVLTLFGGIYFFLDQAGVSPADRVAPLVLLAVVVLVAAIWQAAGMAVARIHMMLEKVELDPGARRRTSNPPSF
jgi:hypothetical protein